jgi:hypothetical protein
MVQRSSSGVGAFALLLAGGTTFGGVCAVALVVGVCRSGWASWVVAAAAAAALAVLSAVPLGVVALIGALAHPGSRGWLAHRVDLHLERRHATRLAAAETPAQHLHLDGPVADRAAEHLRSELPRGGRW